MLCNISLNICECRFPVLRRQMPMADVRIAPMLHCTVLNHATTIVKLMSRCDMHFEETPSIAHRAKWKDVIHYVKIVCSVS